VCKDDHGRLDDIDEVAQGFQPEKPVLFDIKNEVLAALRENQLSGKESEDCNAPLTHFLKTMQHHQPRRSFRVREKTMYVCLFSKWTGRGLAQHTCDDLKKAFLHCFFLRSKYIERRKEIFGFKQEVVEIFYNA